jgi:hypothetical protein
MSERATLWIRYKGQDYACHYPEDKREIVEKYVWYIKKGRKDRLMYASTPIFKDGKRATITMHRLLANAKPGQHVDHVDGNGLNNYENLRITDRSGNGANRPRNKTTVSRFKGVYPNGAGWRSEIRVRGKRHLLGTFPTKQQAARAYDAAAERHFGEFARTNVMLGLLPPTRNDALPDELNAKIGFKIEDLANAITKGVKTEVFEE